MPPAVTLKKNGSIEIGMFPDPVLLSNFFVVKFAFLWYVTPLGKLALSGVLFAQNTP